MANRDAQTLIQGFRQKFPQYKDVDDSTLLSGIQKKYPQYADISMDSLPKSENFLERAINMSSRTTPVGASALDSVPETLKSLFQIGQGTVGNLPQNVVENPVTTAMSGLPGVQMKAGGAMFEDMYNLSNDVLSRFNMAPTEQKTYPFEGDVVPGMDIDIGKMTRPLTEMFMNPQTTRGKIVSGIGNAAAGSIPFTAPDKVAKVASLPGKMIDPFRTKGLQNTFDSLPMAENEIIKGIQSDYGNVSPFISGKGKIGEELKNIEDLGTSKKGISELFKSKRTELTRKRVSDLKSVKDEIEKLSYSGSKNVEEKVSTLFKEANSKFGEGLKNINSSMTDEDMAQIINNAAKDIGAQDIPGTPGNQMKHFSSRYGPKETEGIIQLEPKIYTTEEVQAITRKILSSTSDERSKAIFYKHLSDNLDESVSGLRELKEAHAPIYKMAKQSKLLSKTNIGRVAKGKVSGQELSKFEEAQKMVGVDVLSPAKNTSSKLNQMASEFNLKKDDLSNLEKSSLDNIYKKISESKLNKDNLIHEARQKIDDIKAQYKTTGNKIQSQIDKIKMRRKIAAGLALLFGAGRAISVGKHFVSND